MVLNGVNGLLWFRYLRPEPQLPFHVLELAGRNSTPRNFEGNNGLLYDFTPTAQLFHVTRKRIESCLQCNYTGVEFTGFVSNSGDFLRMSLLEKITGQQTPNELCN
jgi:hypothetical protein